MTAANPPLRRCAIYTRKSSEEGLEQAFNSLQAQRESCEAFIRSQKSEGWHVVDTAYDDGGLSGGTMDRPALRQLLADIGERRIDTVVVYKVDRLTRSLMDFSKIVELFDRHNVSFVAVTQQFNTTTSMGRLTLNILLSFAQFEREVTGERIRDKIAASKRKGMWMGGVTPLGYEVKQRKLLIVPSEAETVRFIYDRYLAVASVRQLKADLEARGIRSKLRVYRDGTQIGGSSFGRGALYALLSNPIYIGKIGHKGVTYPGQHDPIIEPEIWDTVQQRLREHKQGTAVPIRKVESSPLLGKLFDEQGIRLTPSHAVKRGRRYRYYISKALVTGSAKQTDRGWRIPAAQIEGVVAAKAAKMLSDRGSVAAALERVGLQATRLKAVLSTAEDLSRHLLEKSTDTQNLSNLVRRVELRSDRIGIAMDLAPLVAAHDQGVLDPAPALNQEFPLRIKRRGVEMRLVLGGQPPIAAKIDPILLKEIKRAHRCFDALLTGRASIEQLAALEGVDPRYISTVLPLAFLAPDIVDAIVCGRQPEDLTATRLVRQIDLATGWADQRRQLGFG